MGAATDPATATDPFTHLLFAPKPRLAQLYAEVHTPSTLFVQIRGRWFDVAAFAKAHPGGETALRLAAGRDATAMFESAHVFADKKKLDALLKKFVLSDEEAELRGLRTLESALSESDRADEKNEFGENIDWTFGGPFQTEVNRRVVAYFDSEAKRKGITRIQATKATPEKWALILLTGFLFIVSMYYLVRGNRWMVLVAPTMGWFCGVNCFHDGLHFALSTSPFVNEFVGGLFPFFSSPLGWFHQHIIGHHVHTNMKYHDPDLVHGIEARREHKDHPFLPIYKHQSTFLSIGFHFVVGTWLGLGLLNDFKLILSPTLSYNGFVPRIPMTTTALITHGVTRAIYYIGLFGWPYWTFTAAEKGFLEKFMFSMGPAIVFSVLFMVNTQINHLTPSAMEETSLDWATHQVITAQNFGDPKGGKLAWYFHYWFSGGLNLQIEHHLFPTVNACHLDKVSGIVEECCKEFGVRYTRVSGYLEGMREYWKHADMMTVDTRNLKSSGGRGGESIAVTKTNDLKKVD